MEYEDRRRGRPHNPSVGREFWQTPNLSWWESNHNNTSRNSFDEDTRVFSEDNMDTASEKSFFASGGRFTEAVSIIAYMLQM